LIIALIVINFSKKTINYIPLGCKKKNVIQNYQVQIACGLKLSVSELP